eukprot:1215466-Rhodomonas_salina.2
MAANRTPETRSETQRDTQRRREHQSDAPACPRAWSVQTQRRMAELLWLDASHLRPPRCRSCNWQRQTPG